MTPMGFLKDSCKLTIMIGFVVTVLSVAVHGNQVLRVRVEAGEYQIIEQDERQIIEMEGFGYLNTPGKPMLPAKNFLIVLPPGARVKSIEVTGIGATELAGKYSIMPVPPLRLITGPRYDRESARALELEWQNNYEAAYSGDDEYPEVRGKLTCSGTLRKYSYASVSFYPFSYLPLSGKLIFYHAARIAVDYSPPAAGSVEALTVENQKWDKIADEKASRLFVNFREMKDLYEPAEPQPKAGQQTYDYVIITASELQDAIIASNFPNWKISLDHDLRTVLITDTLINGQAGSDLAEKIRNFLRYHYLSWGIEYVLLVGDCETVPMRYCFPDSTNHSFYPYDPYTYGGEVPTDYYYADLSNPDTSSWDSDGDGYCGEYTQDNVDFLTEISVGRIPTSDADRITYTLNKLVTFEQDMGTWKNNVLHAGAILFFENQDFSGYPFIDGARCMNAIETDLMNSWAVSHYCEQEGLVPSSYPWDALTEAAFTADWRTGQYGLVNWSGHGWPRGAVRTIWSWDDGDGVPESQNPTEFTQYNFINTVSSSLDDDYPSIVFAISCNVGYPEANPLGNLGIDLLTLPEFGSSVGVLSATRGAAVSADPPPTGGGAETMCYEFNRHMINGPSGPERIGDALYDGKFYSHHNYGFDHYYEYKNMFDYNLYGDPALAREGVAPFIYGDCNGDQVIDVGDVVHLVNYLYKSGPIPSPIQSGDCNCDETIDLGDVIHLINYLFKEGLPPGECS